MRVDEKSVAIVILTYGNPGRLDHLLRNIEWAGRPDIPLYVVEDYHSSAMAEGYMSIYAKHKIDGVSWLKEWGCMQGAMQMAMERTKEDWIIYIPDDVLFTKGGLWNELSGILTYGREYVAGIQAPYWNGGECPGIPDKAIMDLPSWNPEDLPRNSHWDYDGMPQAYVNLNGAGFSINREFWKAMGGFPQQTWRFDEYSGVMAWKLGYVCITLPGPPRLHYFGGSTSIGPRHDHQYHSQSAFEDAIDMSLDAANTLCRSQMAKLPDLRWDSIVRFFSRGGSLV